MKKSDTFTKFGQSPEATDEVFLELSPGELQKLLDKEEAERLGQSISIRDFERSGILHSSSMKKKGFQDFSMGAYFENRSSYPFPSLNDNVTVMDDPYPQDLPEQDKDATPLVPRMARRNNLAETYTSSSFGAGCNEQDTINSMADSPQTCKKAPPLSPGITTSRRFVSERMSTGSAAETTDLQTSFAQSMQEQNGSINSLIQFFADPEKSPMSSSAIMDHVLEYCKNRSSGHNKNFKPTQKIAQNDPVKIQPNAEINQISMIDDIEVSRRVRESDSNYNVFSKISSSKIPPSSSFLEEPRQRESEAYRNFSQPLIQKLKKRSPVEKSLTTTNINVMQVVQQKSQQLDNQHPFQTPIQGQVNLPVQGSRMSNSNNFKPIPKKAQNDPVKIQPNVKTNQISTIDDIEVSRRLRESNNNYSVCSKMPSSSSFIEEPMHRESEAYRNFSQPLTQKVKKKNRDENSLNTTVNVVQVVQQQAAQQQQQQLNNQHPFQTPIQVQLNLPMQGSMTSNSNETSMQNLPFVINISLPSMMMPPAPSTNNSTASSTDTNGNLQSQPRLSVQFSGSVQWHP